MSCRATDQRAFLTIDTRIVCQDCTLHGGDVVPHEVELVNFGPLDARIDLNGSCTGSFLNYEGGSRTWSQQVTVPARRRRPVSATVSKGIELPGGSTVGSQGCDEEVQLEVKRRRGKGTPEKASMLTLRLRLRR